MPSDFIWAFFCSCESRRPWCPRTPSERTAEAQAGELRRARPAPASSPRSGRRDRPRPGGGRPIGCSAIGFPTSACGLGGIGARFLAARAEREARQDGGEGAQRLAESQWEGEAVLGGAPPARSVAGGHGRRLPARRRGPQVAGRRGAGGAACSAAAHCPG